MKWGYWSKHCKRNSVCHPLSHMINNCLSSYAFKLKLMFLEAPWSRWSPKGFPKTDRGYCPSPEGQVCRWGWGTPLVVRRAASSPQKTSLPENFIWSSHFPPEPALRTSCNEHQNRKPSVAEWQGGDVKEEVMQSSKIAFRCWIWGSESYRYLCEHLLFFSAKKGVTPIHQTTFFICRNLMKKYSQ